MLAYRGLGRSFLGVIGPNGAGKSTHFNVVTDFLPPTTGRIAYLGRDITGKPAHRVAALGIARTFQHIRLYVRMSVLDNVLTAQAIRDRPALWATFLSWPSFVHKERRLRADALARLDDLGPTPYAELPAASLPYGLQRRLEVARALATRPAVLLLDEPAVERAYLG